MENPLPTSIRLSLLFSKMYAYTLPFFAVELFIETLGVVDGSGFVFGVDGGFRWFLFAYSVSFVVLFALLAAAWTCVWSMRPAVPERWVQGLVFQLVAAAVTLWLYETPSIDFPDTRKRIALLLGILYMLTWSVQRMHWSFIEMIEIEHDIIGTVTHVANLVHAQTQYIMHGQTLEAKDIEDVKQSADALVQRIREVQIALAIRKVN